tara:strand:+ start:125 stop:328 length:204 start_codon:yes stop_codon:yes gene_type:complete
MNSAKKILIVIFSFLIALSSLAHTSPEHAIGYTHESAVAWEAVSIVIFTLGLIITISFLLRKIINTK